MEPVVTGRLEVLSRHRLALILFASQFFFFGLSVRPIPAHADGAQTFAALKPSLAAVLTKKSLGTAFCIASSADHAFFLTNAHVMGNETTARVILQSDPTSLLSGHVMRASSLDAVVLDVPQATCKPLTLASGEPAVGTSVAIAGFPAIQFALADNPTTMEPSFHQGTVNASNGPDGFIEYDAQTDHGNSGGPLFDVNSGVVYAMVTLFIPGTSKAVQNNFAISVPPLRTFLDNTHIAIAYAGEPNEPAATTATATNPSQGVPCNAQATAFTLLSKASAELQASDNLSARADAQRSVELASMCAAVITNPCYAGTSPCDDSRSFANGGIMLMGATIERSSAARLHGAFENELRNEIEAVLSLCSSPNLMTDIKPYSLVRPLMLSSLQLYQKFYRLPAYRNLVDYNAVKACGAKLGVDY